MPNYIVYRATTIEEIHQCAYSLLKYLDLCNLKPGAAYHLLVYTTHPEMLEAYVSFFHHFEFRNPEENSDPQQWLKNLAEKGNDDRFLYLATNAYIIKDPGSLFDSIAKGQVFARVVNSPEDGNSFGVLGFSSANASRLSDALRSVSDPGPWIAQYLDLKEFGVLLKNFFKKYQEESVPNQVKLLHHTDAVTIEQQKKKFQQLPMHTRLLRNLTGKGWKISDYSRKI